MNETWWVDPSELDDDQTSILTATADESLLIIGPPGSGKTNILMLRANYVRPIGPRQLFLTFTRSLAEHLKSGPNVGRADRIQHQEISTFMKWAKELIRNNGFTPLSDTGNFDLDRRQIVRQAFSIVEDHKMGKIYDSVFIDEVQDFLEEELKLIDRLAEHVNFAGDSRQRIWKHREGLKIANEIADKTIELKFHYRIGEKICEFADQILPPREDQAPLLEGCNYAESLRPSSIEAIDCSNLNEMVQACIDKIKSQLRYIPDEPIGVIAPFNRILDQFMDEVEVDPILAPITVRQKTNDYNAYDDSSRIRVMTVYSAKGSEFRAVHMFEGESFKNNNRELAFTAVTRAKTEVSVYHVEPLMGHMVPPSGELTNDLATLF